MMHIAFKIMFLGCVIGRRGIPYTTSSLWPCQKHYLKRYTILRSLLLTAALVLLLFGCRSITPAVSYYTMRTIENESTAGESVQNVLSRTIGIRGVSLPGMINRPQMVRRTGSYEIDVEPYHRWAEYPDRMVHQLLRDNLQRLLPEDRVVNAPWPVGLKPDLILSFHFLELIGSDDKKMELSVVWTISEKSGGSPPLSRRTHLIEAIQGNGFDNLAQAHSHVLAELSREVAEVIREMNIE
jgi:uncharacterized lipoprotein YmbA